VAVAEHARVTGSTELIQCVYPNLIRQLRWFQAARRATDDVGGYLYTDISNGTYESGIDQGIRFMDVPTGPFTCVDATAHVYLLCRFAVDWARHVNADPGEWQQEADRLRRLMNERLFQAGTGFFHDAWLMDEKPSPRLAIEGIWPMVVGAAEPELARRVIDENLLNPHRFFSHHPLASVGVEDRWFELRMWRGPAWNSMTYWAAVGCLKYGRADAAEQILRRALDASAVQFERTGTIWEFYHPHGGRQEDVERKPTSKFNQPCKDYLGHNPLVAMARLYDRCAQSKPSPLENAYVNAAE
jgi:glycogen debranching enzyme